MNAGLSFFSGDGPACAALLCTQGHSAEFCCYRCYFRGSKAPHSNDAYYFLGHPRDNRLEMRSPASCDADCQRIGSRLPGASSRSVRTVQSHRGTKGRPGLTDVILGGNPYESTLHDGAHAIKNFSMLAFQLLLGLKKPTRPAAVDPVFASHSGKITEYEQKMTLWRRDCKAHDRWKLPRGSLRKALFRWQHTGAPKNVIDPKSPPWNNIKSFYMANWMALLPFFGFLFADLLKDDSREEFRCINQVFQDFVLLCRCASHTLLCCAKFYFSVGMQSNATPLPRTRLTCGFICDFVNVYSPGIA